MSEEYHIRSFEPQDRTAFLDLYECVHGERKGRAWLDWKYTANPFTETTAIVVAEYDEMIVGARPLFGIPIRRGSMDAVARQPSDAMVHPDHRRRGVFTRMIEYTVNQCEKQNVDFLFTFPNTRSGGAYRKLGWDVVGELTECFRVNRSGPIIAARSDVPTVPGVGRLVDGAINVAALRKRFGRPRSADVVTRSISGVPVSKLNGLYRESIPDALHAPRTEKFLNWRFQNPDWEYRTFLGYHQGTLMGAIVTGTRQMADGEHVTRCVDILPFDGDWRRDATIEVILTDILAALDDVALFVLPGEALPTENYERLGFLSNGSLPIKLFTEPTLLFVQQLSGRAGEFEITDPDAWSPTFVEYDTA